MGVSSEFFYFSFVVLSGPIYFGYGYDKSWSPVAHIYAPGCTLLQSPESTSKHPLSHTPAYQWFILLALCMKHMFFFHIGVQEGGYALMAFYFHIPDTCGSQEPVLLGRHLSEARCNQLGGCVSGNNCAHNTGKTENMGYWFNNTTQCCWQLFNMWYHSCQRFIGNDCLDCLWSCHFVLYYMIIQNNRQRYAQ